MHKRFYAQRLHLVTSLHSVLYRLHVLSFFLSPSIWPLALRLFSQLHCGRPKDMDFGRSLRFHYVVILLFNIPPIWSHAKYGPSEGRALVLDFVGLAYTPSKLQLFTLDITILGLLWLVTTLSYETALSSHSTEDTLTQPPSSDTTLPFAGPSRLPGPEDDPEGAPTSRLLDHIYSNTTKSSNATTSTYDPNVPPEILHLRFRPLIARLRNPPPIVSRTNSNATRSAEDPLSLPFPNTTTFPIPASMRALMRSQQPRRNSPFETSTTPQTIGASPLGRNTRQDSREDTQRIPGGMDRE